MSTLVFVYGTLKRGGENHEWIEGQHFVAKARTRPVYRMFDLGGYPGMVRSADGLAIQGEIWLVDGPGLLRLDVLEDIEGGEYERVDVEIEGEFANRGVEGYIYLPSVEGHRDVGECW